MCRPLILNSALNRVASQRYPNYSLFTKNRRGVHLAGFSYAVYPGSSLKWSTILVWK